MENNQDEYYTAFCEHCQNVITWDCNYDDHINTDDQKMVVRVPTHNAIILGHLFAPYSKNTQRNVKQWHRLFVRDVAFPEFDVDMCVENLNTLMNDDYLFKYKRHRPLLIHSKNLLQYAVEKTSKDIRSVHLIPEKIIISFLQDEIPPQGK